MLTRGLGPKFDSSKCVIKVIKQLTFCAGITSANFEGGGARLALTRAVHSKFRMGGIGQPLDGGGGGPPHIGQPCLLLYFEIVTSDKILFFSSSKGLHLAKKFNVSC